MARTVVGVFDSYDDAQEAMQELVDEGFRREDINIMSNNTAGSDATSSRTDDTGDNRSFGDKVSNFFGSLFGDDADDDDRGYYSEAVRRGGVMVTVSADEDRIDRIVEIMEDHDVVDIDRRAASYRESGYTGYDRSATAYTAEETEREREMYRNRTGDEGEVRVPVVEENIEVGKRQVKRGGVRVYNRIEERPVEENVTLREEHVSVERRPVDRPITDADVNNLREGVIEVTETAEEPVIAKRARVAEEVVINKEVGERTETVRDTVRRTDVDVQELDDSENVSSKKARNRR
jgi:uncharacterized protein (TIGR02271 family)